MISSMTMLSAAMASSKVMDMMVSVMAPTAFVAPPVRFFSFHIVVLIVIALSRNRATAEIQHQARWPQCHDRREVTVVCSCRQQGL